MWVMHHRLATESTDHKILSEVKEVHAAMMFFAQKDDVRGYCVTPDRSVSVLTAFTQPSTSEAKSEGSELVQRISTIRSDPKDLLLRKRDGKKIIRRDEKDEKENIEK